MPDDFGNQPPPPIGSIEEAQAQIKKVKSLKDELVIRIADLEKAVAEVQKNPSDKQARKVLAHRMKQVKSLMP